MAQVADEWSTVQAPDGRDLEVLMPQAPEIAAITGAEVVAMLDGLVDDVDRAALTGEFAEVMAEDFRRGVSTSVAGWHDDALAFARPWGFDLGDITVPVSVWQGAHDLMVPSRTASSSPRTSRRPTRASTPTRATSRSPRSCRGSWPDLKARAGV